MAGQREKVRLYGHGNALMIEGVLAKDTTLDDLVVSLTAHRWRIDRVVSGCEVGCPIASPGVVHGAVSDADWKKRQKADSEAAPVAEEPEG